MERRDDDEWEGKRQTEREDGEKLLNRNVEENMPERGLSWRGRSTG